jgi:amino acid adenylation domain-containing protein
VAADPGRRLSDVPLLLPEERRLLEAWGRGPERPVPPAPVHELIRRQALRAGGATAVVCGEERLSYGELEARASRLAHHLRALGAGPEVPVGVCLERSPEMVVAVLGVLKAGAAYLPLDPRSPPARLAALARDARAPLVVTQRSLLDRAAAPGTAVVCVDGEPDRSLISARPAADPAVPVHPLNLAYVIYTSGSTGAPKGVQVPHAALRNLVAAMRESPGLEPADVQAAVASLAFDASVAELFPPLAAGACVVVATGEEAGDGDRLRARVLQAGVTVLQATATTWLLLRAAGGVGGGRVRALCGGEVTPPELAEALAAGHPSAWHLYGPTEATVWATAGPLAAGGPVPLGRPLANTRLRVLDGALREVPVGVAGELCIGGASLARGYLGRPALTAERFVPDPFARVPGERLYRTGDLARYGADGRLQFIGRLDHQAKVRGYRVEPGEVEAALASHPAVERAVVVAHPSAAGGARLIAYVAPPPAGGATEVGRAAELGRHLRERLPEYMVPGAFVFVNSFPTTPTGKVDRMRLAPPPPPRPELEAGYLAPRTPLEREVAEAFARHLGVERVGVRDDFFALGGHSLLAAVLVSELRERHQVDLLLQEVFLAPSVERLAGLIEEERARARHLASEEARLDRVVGELSDEAVDRLLEHLLAAGGETVAHGEA